MPKTKVIWDESGFSSGAGTKDHDDERIAVESDGATWRVSPPDRQPDAERIAGLVERLRQYTPEEYERTMKDWDRWREAIAGGSGASWPRDCFESYLDVWHYDAKEAADALEQMQVWEGLANHNRDAALEAEQRAERAEAAHQKALDDWLSEARKWEAEISRLREALTEAVAMLQIYYVPNADGSAPTLSKARAALAPKEEE